MTIKKFIFCLAIIILLILTVFLFRLDLHLGRNIPTQPPISKINFTNFQYSSIGKYGFLEWILSAKLLTIPEEPAPDIFIYNLSLQVFEENSKEKSSTIFADFGLYNQNTKDFYLEGNIIIFDGSQKIETDYMIFDAETEHFSTPDTIPVSLYKEDSILQGYGVDGTLNQEDIYLKDVTGVIENTENEDEDKNDDNKDKKLIDSNDETLL